MKDPEKTFPKELKSGYASQGDVDKEIAAMIKEIDHLYHNKSSDEYRMCGDITKSPVYDTIESGVANLKTLKNFPKNQAQDYQQLFNGLHRPMFKTAVAEYLKSPNEKNVIFTALFTVGYRTLVGDLSRIYASTEATESGIVYHPEQESTKHPLSTAFIKSFNKNLDDKYNEAVRARGNRPKMHQEAAAFMGLAGAAITAFAAFSKAHELGPITAFFRDVFNRIFGARKELNPVSFISHRLTKSYDGLVDRYKDTQKLYDATKDAYEEYKKSYGRHNPRVELNYQKNMKKYNIMMKTLKAKIDHFDSRAEEEAKEQAYRKRMEDRERMLQPKESTPEPPPKPKPFSAPKPSAPKPTESAPKPSEDERKPTAPPPKVDTGDLDF